MSTFILKNEDTFVEIDEKASEIIHLKNLKTDIEYIWQADPKYWTGRNPTLFPLVGSTWDKILHINGKEYKTGNHGFARHAMFTCTKHTDTCIEMTLKENEDTLSQYPFHFVLKNVYELTGSSLKITTIVENTDTQVLPFSVGYHPAFNCPLEEGKAMADYEIVMDEEEEGYGKRISLDPEALAKTIILSNPKSTSYSLTDGSHGVNVKASNYPWVAFWSPNAPFVCIEPWHTHTDFEKVDVPFEQREGTILLESGKSWSTFYTISIF